MPDDLPTIRHRQFEYSPLLHGVYRGMLWTVIPVALLGWEILVGYVSLLLFLGFGLRPLLELTGLYRLLSHSMVVIQEKTDEKFLKKRAEEIDRKTRDEKYRKRRLKHPDLPKHW
ncbi:MAG: hypothetical protein MI746_03780 [Pseudomonadales bacterium]|nr:hypothetical protein [Pseudomonadales bacterium]